MISLDHLTKRYGDRVAVDDLTLRLRPGAVTGFLGPNGAGKSTTMRMILGLDRPTAGRALIGRTPYPELDNPLRVVGALLDARGVHPGRSVRAHLLALARSNGIGTARVGEVLETVGLGAVAGKRAGTLSLGMSQRLGIAAALLGDPEVLMFDEPVNGLDPDGVRWVRRLMRSLAAEGRTVFVSSHLMSEMQLTADHLVVIGRGRLLADAPLSEVLAATAVLVRTPHAGDLAARLAAAGVAVERRGENELVATGAPIERVGDLAHEAGVRLHELSPREPSLEQAYQELTAGSVEYGSAR
ncbi:ABC transporter ATP-binding protein [Nonomuraea sp. NPDC047897]|uniref:ABC transporter ATP-binding protein n=1 Tax=Nonomuraea sp. NPDC047897 TaxID=3364346 RepID=UPI00371F5220